MKRVDDIVINFPTSSLCKGKSNVFNVVVLGTIFLIAGLDFITGQKVIGSTTVATILLPFFPLFVLMKLTSRIRFRDDYIEKITILGKTRIHLKDMRSYGICIQYGRFLPKEVDETEVDENSVLADNIVFISTLDHFDVDSEGRKETITFQYRKDIYETVKEVLTTTQSDERP